MTDSRYDLLCAVLLGVGQLTMFTGFDASSFVVEPVLHSVHDRSPNTIDAHAGYYGQAVLYGVYTMSNLFAPSILAIIGAKLSLVIGSSHFTLYLCSFLYVHYVPYYVCSGVLGIGYALFYTGHGCYLVEHSSRRTVERNSALVWGIGTTCLVLGGIVMLIITHANQATVMQSITEFKTLNSSTSEHRSYREFSDQEIRLLYGAFALISLVSNILFASMPTRPVKNSLAAIKREGDDPKDIRKNIGRMFSAIADPRMRQLAPLFCLIGTSTAFWCGAYSTTLQFSKKLSGFVYLPAMYSIIVGIGDMSMSLFISWLGKRVPNFGQKPSLTIGVLMNVSAVVLIVLSTPSLASIQPTDAETLLFEPSVPLALFTAFLLGVSDACYNSSRTVICAIAMPNARAQAFSISKFYQSLATSLLFLLSSFITVPTYATILVLNNFLAIYFFFKVANSTKKMERKATEEARASAEAGVGRAIYEKKKLEDAASPATYPPALKATSTGYCNFKNESDETVYSISKVVGKSDSISLPEPPSR